MTDSILPFMLEKSSLRGRMITLDHVLDQIMVAHNYPESVSALLSEAATLAVLLGSTLKYQGIFTLQIQTEGRLQILVSDFTSEGDLRACAQLKDSGENQVPLLGKGYVAFTVDQGEHTERYQGIVELKDGPLVESVQSYFLQSEQIRTGISMAAAKVAGAWKARAVLLQDMPEEGGNAPSGEAQAFSESEEHWRRSMMLLQTCTQEELLDGSLSAPELLFRLFHEEGVRVFDERRVQKNCRCTMEKIRGVLSSLSADEIHDLVLDNKISVKCEFCSHEYIFNPAEIGDNK
ncbi:MAG: Hsp33 family molecular chaperone HslO [Micavibrio sp.]